MIIRSRDLKFDDVNNTTRDLVQLSKRGNSWVQDKSVALDSMRDH